MRVDFLLPLRLSQGGCKICQGQLRPDYGLGLDLAKEYAAAKVMHETKGKSQ